MDVRGFGLTEEEMRALGYEVARETRGNGGDGSADASGARGDRAARTWFWTLVILAALGWGASSIRRLPDPVPANRSDTLFSSARAMSQLVEIARHPRLPGSPEHDRVRSHLIGRLRSLGLDPRVQTTTVVVGDSGTARTVTIRNVLARLPGTASTGAILLTAHYDTAPLSPGAGDDGVGVAALLETVRAVLAGEPLRNDLIVLLSDAGALGQSGTRAFVEAHPWVSEVAFVVSAEMRGVSGPAFLFESGPENGWLIETLATAGSRPTATSLSREIPSDWPSDRALSSFRAVGIPGLNLTGLGGRGVHHQVTDCPERVSEKTLQHVGSQLLSLARALGGVDLDKPSGLGGPDQAYFSVPLLGLEHHPLDWVFLISLGLICGWVLMMSLLRLRGGSWKGLIAGTLLGVILAVGAFGIGWGVFETVRLFHPEYGLLESAFYRDGVHFLALGILLVGWVAGGYGIVRRRYQAGELFLGALVVPIGVAVWLGFYAPFGAGVLQWPAALSLLSAGLLTALGPNRGQGRLAWAAALLVAGGVLSVLVPNLEFLAAVLTFRGAPLFSVAVALGLILLLPTMEWLRKPRGWWTPTLALAVAMTLVASATPPVLGASAHPVFTTLAYLVEDTVEVPGLGADSAGAMPPPGVRRVAGQWLTIPGPGESWARSWVPEEGCDSTNPGPLFLPQGDRWVIAGSGPETHVAVPLVRVLADRTVGGQRELDLVVGSGLKGEMIGVRIPEDRGEITSVNGISCGGNPGAGPVRELVHWGDPEGGVLSVGIRLDAGAAGMHLEIVEHHLRPREVLGEGFFRRDESLLPNAPAGSDRIVQRTRITISDP